MGDDSGSANVHKMEEQWSMGYMGINGAKVTIRTFKQERSLRCVCSIILK